MPTPAPTPAPGGGGGGGPPTPPSAEAGQSLWSNLPPSRPAPTRPGPTTPSPTLPPSMPGPESPGPGPTPTPMVPPQVGEVMVGQPPGVMMPNNPYRPPPKHIPGSAPNAPLNEVYRSLRDVGYPRPGYRAGDKGKHVAEWAVTTSGEQRQEVIKVLRRYGWDALANYVQSQPEPREAGVGGGGGSPEPPPKQPPSQLPGEFPTPPPDYEPPIQQLPPEEVPSIITRPQIDRARSLLAEVMPPRRRRSGSGRLPAPQRVPKSMEGWFR